MPARRLPALVSLAVFAFLLTALLTVRPAGAWRSPENFEGSAALVVSDRDSQPSREPDIALAPDGSLIATWSDQFSMKVGRSFLTAVPEFSHWTVSTIAGSAVPSGTAEDTSKPAIAVLGTKVAVAYLFNYPRASGTGHQHDVMLATGTITSSGSGVTWDKTKPTRITATDGDDARRVAVAFDATGNIHLAWEDDPTTATNNVVRYFRVGSSTGAVVLSDPAGNATWPVLEAENASLTIDRVHVAYTQSGKVVHRFLESDSFGIWSDPTVQAGTNTQRPDLAVVPSGDGSPGTPIVVYDDAGCDSRRHVFAVAPGIAPTQLSRCGVAAHQQEATVGVRASDRTVYAVWVEPGSTTSFGPLHSSRMRAAAGWRWWTPVKVNTSAGDITTGWWQPQMVVSASGEQVVARGATTKASSGQEIAHVSNFQPPHDVLNAKAARITGGVRLSWDQTPSNSSFHAIKILRKATDDFTGPNDPAATHVTTLYQEIQVIDGEYQNVTPLPTSYDDTTADPDGSYVYRLYVSHRGPRPATNFSESPGYRFGTSVAYGSPPAATPPPSVPKPPPYTTGRRIADLDLTPGDGQVTLTWTNPMLFDEVRIVRRADFEPSGPSDGVQVYAGGGASFTDTGLENGVEYFYGVYTVYDGDKLSDLVIDSAVPDVAGAPITYTAYPGGTYAGTASSYNLGGVFHLTEDKTVLKLGKVFEPGSTAGNQIGLWDEETQQLLFSAVVSPNDSVAYLPEPVLLEAGRRYVIAVKEESGTPWSPSRVFTKLPDFLVIDDTAFNRESTFSYPDLRGGKPGYSNEDWTMTFGAPDAPALVPADPVTSLAAAPAHARVELSWTNPASFDSVRIIRKAGSPPSGPRDGTLVYLGSGASHSDTGLVNGTTYHYAVYTKRGRELSRAVRASATPALPSGLTTYTTQPTGDYSGTASDYNLGVVFHVTSDKLVYELGRLYKSGSTAANQVGIWEEATQALVFSTTLSPTSPTATLTTPLLLQAGKRYVLGFKEEVGSPWSPSRTLTSLPSFLVIDDAAFNRQTTFSYPDQRSSRPGAANEDWTMTFGEPGGLPVSSLKAAASAGRVDLSWLSPPDAARIQVVRKAGSAPTGPTDGTPVFDGVGNAHTDTGLANGTTYHYAVYVKRGSELSAARTTSAMPALDTLEAVAGLKLQPGDGRADLAWTNPGPLVIAALGDSYTTAQYMHQASVDSFQSSWSTGQSGTDLVQSHYEQILAVNPAIAGRNYNFAQPGSQASALLAQADNAVAAGAQYVTILSGLNDVCVTPPAQMTGTAAYRTAVRAALDRLNAGLPNARIFVASIPDPTPLWTLFGSDANVRSIWESLKRCMNVLGPTVTDADRAAVRAHIQTLNQVLADECSAVARCRFDLGATFGISWTAADFATTDYFHLSEAGSAKLAAATWPASFWPDSATTEVVVVRSDTGPPADPSVGEVVYRGAGALAADVGLTNGTTYDYGVWYGRGGRVAPPARGSATPSQYVTYRSQPTGDYANATASYNIGFVFHLTESKSLLKLGRVYKLGSTAGNQIGIWDEATKQLLVSASVTPAAPIVSLSNPLVLEANKRYVLGVVEAVGSPWSNGRVLTGLPPFLVVDDSAYNRNSTLSYPDGRDYQTAPVKVAEDVSLTFGRPDSEPLPVLSPVGSLAATAVDGRVDLSWTNPATTFDRVVVVRTTGFAAGDPSEGTVVYSGTATSASDTGLVNGTLYHYAVWVQRGGDLSVPARIDSTPTGAIPDPVKSLVVAPGNGRVDLGWANPTSPFDSVQIVRKAGSAPANPADGTVVHSGTGTALADTGLTNGTLYYYALWTYRGTETSQAVRASAVPGSGPLNPVSNLQALAGDRTVAFSWTSPTSFDRIKVVRKTDTFPSGPTDGTVVFDGTGSLASDVGLANGTTYYYAVWAERAGQLSPTTLVSATPELPGVTALQATPTDRRVDLAWTNPSVPFDRIRVVRKADSPPSGPSDGTLVFDGTSTLAADVALKNGTVYHYAAWVERGSELSAPARAVAIPIDATTVVTYAASPTGDYAGTIPDYNLGAVFHVTADKALLEVGRAYAPGSTAPNQLGIWDEASQTLLYSTTVSPSAPVATLQTPLLLRAGKRYVIAIKQEIGTPWSGRRTLTGLPSFLVIDDAAFSRTKTFGYPNGRDNAPGQSNEDWRMTFGDVGTLPPPADPVTALQTAPGDAQVSLSWTNPTSAFERVVVRRKAGSEPSSPYDGTLVFSGTGTTLTDVGLANGTTYHYGVWVENAGLFSTAARATAAPRLGPPDPVTSLQAATGDQQVTLAWISPSGAYDRIKVVRKAGQPPVDPSDGTVAFEGVGNSVTDTGLLNATLYYYAVWVERSGVLSAVATTSATPVEPSLDAVTNVAATPDDFKITLSWRTPETPFDSVKVVRKEGSDPVDLSDGTLVYSGLGTTVVDTGLANGTRYHYGVWTQRADRLSTSVYTSATPAPPPITPVTGLQAAPGNYRVDLAWTQPSTRFDAIVVVRKSGSSPTGPADGTVVYRGTGSAYSDTGIANGLTYFYDVYAERDGQFSSAAETSATPRDPTSDVTYSTQPTGNYALDTSGYNLGAVFHVTVDKSLVELGRIYKAGSTAGNRIGIWDEATKSLLGAVDVTPAAPKGKLSTPILLQAGKRYVLGIKENIGSPASQGRLLTGLPDFLVIDDSAFNRNTTFSYPDLRGNKAGNSNEDWTMTFGSVGTAPAPNPVTALSAAPGDTTVDLTWENPADFDRVMVVRKADAPPADPTDGTVVFSGVGTAVGDTGLANGTEYHYAVWVDRDGFLSTEARTSAIPQPEPPGPVTDLAATAGEGTVALTWTNPTTPFDAVRVVRKASEPPADATDGEVLFVGTGSSVVDTALTNGTRYHYAVWAERDAETSSAARTSAVPSDLTPFTTQPAGTYGMTANGYVIGFVFHVTVDRSLVKLGRIYKPGSTATNRIGIWEESSQTLLHSATIGPSAPDSYLPAPIELKAGTRYVVGVKEETGSPWSGGRVATGLPQFMILDDSAFLRSTAFGYPSGRDKQTAPIKLAEDIAMTFGAPERAAVAKPDPVSDLTLAIGDGRLDVSWTSPTTAFDRIEVVRKAGSQPSGPTDGTLVYSGSGTGFADTGLVNGQLYEYAAWVVQSDERSTVSRASATPTGALPDPVHDLAALTRDGAVDLSWANPTSPLDRVLVVRKAGADPADPSDGSTVYSGTGTGVSDTGLVNGTAYHYGVWVERSGVLSSPARTVAIPDVPPPDSVTGLQATGGDASVSLSWQSPTSFDTIRVVRKAGADPADPSDGTLVFEGTGSLAVDSGLANGTTYHYAVWAERDGVLSTAARITATPQAAPVAPVSDLAAAYGNARVDLMWTNPAEPFDAVVVVRKAGAEPATPADGVEIFRGVGSSFADTAVANGTTYHYGVWVERAGVLSTPVRTATTPIDPLGVVGYAVTPTGGFANTDASFNIGTVFHVTVDKALLSLGRAYAPGSTASNPIGLFDATTGALIVSTTVSPSAPVALLPTPVLLEAGRQYVIGIKEASGSPWSAARTVSDLPSFLVLDDTAYNRASTFSFPNVRDNQTAPIKLAEDWTMTFGAVGEAAATPDPATGLAAGTGDGRVDLTWANPATPFDAIKVVRKEGTDPAHPADGTLVYSGTSTGVADTGLVNGTAYHYAVWVVHDGALSTAARATATPAVPPPDPVTGLLATPGDARVALSWANPSGAFDAVRVVRKAGGAPADPSDGTQVYAGTGTSATDTGLANGTMYYYAVWVEHGTLLSNATRASATPALDPLDPVTKLSAASGDLRVDVTWTNPTTPFDAIVVVRKQGADPVDPTDGTLLYSGTGTSFADTSVVNDTTYHYAAWAQRGERLSDVARDTATPGAPLLEPVGSFDAVAANGRVDLSWTNPDFRFDRVVVVRKVGADPAGPSDGTTVYAGTGTSVADLAVSNGTVYHYAAWIERDGELSPAARDTAAPIDPASLVSYTTKPTGTYARSDAGFVLGAVFHVTADKVLTEIGRVYQPGSGGTLELGLWEDATQKLLFSTSVTAAAPKATLPTPLKLTAGTRYVIGVKTRSGTPWSESRLLTDLPGFLVVDDAAFTANATTLIFPTGRSGKPGWSNEDWTMTFAAVGTVTADPVTGLAATWNDQRVDLAWQNPATYDFVRVVRKAGSPPTGPSDGTIAFRGSAASLADTGLTNGTEYHYGVWVEAGGVLSTVERVSATPNVPVDDVTALAAAGSDLRVDLTWTNPSNITGVRVVRKAGSEPGGPDDGTVVFSGLATSYADTGVDNGTEYHYAVWAERDELLSFNAARASATPTPPPLEAVSSLKATAGNAQVALSWTNPSIRITRVIVARKAGSGPTSPTDGTQVYSGTGSSITDSGLANGTEYHYGVWVERDGELSSAARASAIPFDDGTKITYTTVPTGNYAGTASSYNLGAVFRLAEDKVLVELGRVYKAGSTAGNRMGIWEEATKQLVVATDVTPAAPLSNLGDGVLLKANTNYVLGIKAESGSPWSQGRVLTELPPFLEIIDSAYNRNSTFSYPDLRGNKPGGSNEDWTMTFAAAGSVPTPDPVTNLAAAAGDTRVDLTWTNPTHPFDEVRVVRKAGADPANPDDGTLVYNGPGTSVGDTAVANGTEYHYAVWVVRGGKLSSAARALATPLPPPVSGLGATGGDLSVSLSWTNPSPAPNSVKVVRKAGSDPTGPADGTLVYDGPGTSAVDTGLVNGTTYHYAVWAERGGVLSLPVRTTATPVAGPVDPVTNLSASPGNTTVDLAWTNPSTRFDRVLVIRKAGGDPASPSDGTEVYRGTGTSFADTGLTNGTTYHYGVWVERDGDLSPAARAKAMPYDALSAVTYRTEPTGNYAGTSSSYNLGAVFYVTEKKAITEIGRIYKAGSTASNQVGIWNESTKALLYSATVSPASPTVTLTTPLVVTAGTRYVIGFKEESGSPWSQGRLLTGLPPFLVIVDSAYNRNSTFSYPDLRGNKPGYSNEDWLMTFAPTAG